MRKRHRVVAALIAGDGILTRNGKENLDRCLESLKLVCEKVFVAFNGDADINKVRDTFPDEFIVWKNIEWKDDFAFARNENFSMVRDYMVLSKTTYDWILWIDTDDTLEFDQDPQDMLDELDPSTQVVMLRYDYAVDPDTETVLAVQWRERFFRTDVPTKWWYPIHEVCRTPIGTQYARKGGVWIRHWREPKLEDQATRERNRRILTKARNENPGEPRFKYYLANEIYAEAALAAHTGSAETMELSEAAIKAYEDYIPEAPSPDDAYIAAHQVGELHRIRKDFISAIESELRAMMIHPTWPDAYIGIAQSYMELEDWDKCEFWARSCIRNSTGDQETTQVREPLNNEYIPRLLLGIALENKGQLIDALAEYERIAQFNLTKEVEEKIDAIHHALEVGELKSEIEPNNKVTRERLFGSRPDKSIAFFTAPLFEPWHPKLAAKGGIGGAETCVMEVAKRFSADGWRTVVFGTPGEYEGVDPDTGVEYWNTADFLAPEKFTVFVSSRIPQVFDSMIQADYKMLWMHDVNVGDNMGGDFHDRIDQVDSVIGLTDWHCNHLRRLYTIPEEKMVKLPNGVDLSRFGDGNPNNVDRQKYKFVWSSSPDRGIDVVLSIWPEIKRRYPEAELHVYYGWNSIFRILESYPDHPLKIFVNSVESMLESLGREDAGIYWHDRIDQKTLAKELMTCHAWLYPTYFMETFCITAVEMQAAGVLPVVSNVAALRETVKADVLKVDGWPNNDTFKRQYLTAVETAVNSSSFYQKSLQQLGYNHSSSYTWDDAYEKWLKVINSKVPVLV